MMTPRVLAPHILRSLASAQRRGRPVTLQDLVDVLKVRPFDEMGTAVELVKLFGGKEQYQKAVRDLEQALYAPDGSAA